MIVLAVAKKIFFPYPDSRIKFRLIFSKLGNDLECNRKAIYSVLSIEKNYD